MRKCHRCCRREDADAPGIRRSTPHVTSDRPGVSPPLGRCVPAGDQAGVDAHPCLQRVNTPATEAFTAGVFLDGPRVAQIL